jgi:hypothetical protein
MNPSILYNTGVDLNPENASSQFDIGAGSVYLGSYGAGL